MAIKVPKEVNRMRGYTLRDGVTLVAGMCVIKDPSDSTGETIMLSNGTTVPIGLALETNVAFSPSTKYFDDINKGGKVACTYGPVLAELYDDGRGSPYDSTQTYTINKPLFVDSNGRVSTTGSGFTIGYVDKTPGTDGILRARIIVN